MYLGASPYFMRREHGWGPKYKTCGDCIFCRDDERFDEDDGICTHDKSPHKDFVVGRDFKACGLFRSQWQYERELLEAQGQLILPVPALIKMKERHFYDLPPGAEMADQDWTTPGFWPRTKQ